MYDVLEMAKQLLSYAWPQTVVIDRQYGPDSHSPMEVDIHFSAIENRDVIYTLGHGTDYRPLRILKSGNRTIVFWSDGTKTVVKRAEDEPNNDYAAFTAALGIKVFGSNSALRRIIKRNTTVQEKSS